MFRLHIAGGAEEFQPFLCESHSHALTSARQWLDQNPDCEAIDVLYGESELFLVGRPD
jgi:hypothetical protein